MNAPRIPTAIPRRATLLLACAAFGAINQAVAGDAPLKLDVYNPGSEGVFNIDIDGNGTAASASVIVSDKTRLPARSRFS